MEQWGRAVGNVRERMVVVMEDDCKSAGKGEQGRRKRVEGTGPRG